MQITNSQNKDSFTQRGTIISGKETHWIVSREFLEKNEEFAERSKNDYEKLLNGLRSNSIEKVTTSAAEPSELSIYYLNFAKLTPQENNDLCKAFLTNTSVKEIFISGQHIDSSLTNVFAEILRNNHSLEKLKLRHCQIEEEVIFAIAEALKNNNHLKSLDFQCNKIGLKESKAIAEALNVNKTLISLNLFDTVIPPEGVNYLLDAVKGNSTLTSFSLDFLDDQTNSIIQALSGHSSLKKFLGQDITEILNQIAFEDEADRYLGILIDDSINPDITTENVQALGKLYFDTSSDLTI